MFLHNNSVVGITVENHFEFMMNGTRICDLVRIYSRYEQAGYDLGKLSYPVKLNKSKTLEERWVNPSAWPANKVRSAILFYLRIIAMRKFREDLR